MRVLIFFAVNYVVLEGNWLSNLMMEKYRVYTQLDFKIKRT